MKTPPLSLITRMAPFGSTVYHSRLILALVAGSTALSTQAPALENLWLGTTTDWNTPSNWSRNRVPTNANGEAPPAENFDDAVINLSSPNPARITANLAATPRDIIVGGTNGRLIHSAGNAATGGGNWMFVGRGGGTGTYDLVDPGSAGGVLTGNGPSSGNLTIGGRLYVGGFNGGGGTGTVNVNTTGTLAIGNDLTVGSGGGTGVMRVDAGTITTGGWNFIGKNEGGAGGNGTLNLSGGTLTNNGNRTFIGLGDTVGALNLSGTAVYNNQAGGNDTFLAVGVQNLANAAVSELNLSGGTLRVAHLLSVGGVEPAGGNGDAGFIGSGKGIMRVTNPSALVEVTGEFWAGQGADSVGTIQLDAGTINVNSWVAIGRTGGTGTLNMSGGTITKTGAGTNFIIGSSGPGTMTQSGGLVDVQAGITWIAEQNATTGTLTLSGTGEFRTSILSLAPGPGTTANLNLNGGTLVTGQITGGQGIEFVSFNGTRIVATSNGTTFIQNLGDAQLGAGGLVVDSNNFGVTIPQSLAGTGGVTKTGAGTVTLTGTNNYYGPTAISAGTLVISSNQATVGDITVANGATLGVLQSQQDVSLVQNNVTFGTNGPSRLDINLGNFPGNTPDAALDVTGTLQLNGVVTINIADQLPETGIIPLVSYGSKTGTGSFVLGTLPNGVVATLSDNGAGLVSLNVTSVALPYWNGSITAVWDTTTANWVNLVGGGPTNYANGNPVLFDDNATGPAGTDVLLNSTVAPASVTFNNSIFPYSLNGTGSISGSTGLTKQGTSSLTIGTLNNYTGVTTLTGGTTSISTLGNGGTPGNLGAASSAPANLVLNGGTLAYTGAAASSDRGFTLTANNSTIATDNTLTLSGTTSVPTPTVGSFIKAGPGNLILTNPGTLTLGGNASTSRVREGTLTLRGSGTQVVRFPQEFWVGDTADLAANLVLENTTLNATSWIAVGVGNGLSDTISSVTATNSTITSNGFSTGFDNGRTNNSTQTVTLTNTNWTNDGANNLAEGNDSTSNLVIGGTSVFTARNQFLMGIGTGAVSNVTIQDSGVLDKTGGWLAIGNSNNATGNMLIKNSGQLLSNGDFNIGDVGTSQGILTIQDNAIVNSTGTAFIGKGSGTNGSFIVNGGSFTCSNFVTIGRYTGDAGKSIGNVTVNAGSFNQTATGSALIIGEEGIGTLTIAGTGSVNVSGAAVYVSNSATGLGTLNLNGGTLTARQVTEGAASAGAGTVNFNGGLLRAATGANANFLFGLDGAIVLAGGANIDTNGNNITIAQALLSGGPGGGLTKSGAGLLLLDGLNTYTGPTTVTTGSLGGSGSVAGPLTVSAGAGFSPGAANATGSFSAGATTIAGTFSVEIDGTSSDLLTAAGTLNVSSGTLAINTLTGGATQTAYVIASYTGATPAPFASITGLPPGYAVNYAYNNGVNSTNIAIVSTGATPFTSWISGFFPGSTDPAVIGSTADPDKDGQSNALEFALGGAPNSGSNNAKIQYFAQDGSVDADTTPELLMTIAVRSGTPVFTGSPASSATQDGFTVTVEGTTDLSTFPAVVTPVAPVSTGLPAAPAGYEYRTFSLGGSNGLTSRGFLRVRVTP